MKQKPLILYYDGECPFCSSYVRYYRLGLNNIRLEPRDARTTPDQVTEFNARGLNLDKGMIVVYEGVTYHGTDAIHLLALLSSSSGLFNRINRWLFSKHRLAKLLYPVLVRGRNVVLLIQNRSKLN